VTGVDPTWITHNTGPRDFTVPSTNDNSAAGEYVINIRNEILVPDSAEKASFTPLIVDYDFSIFINPCAVSTYTET